MHEIGVFNSDGRDNYNSDKEESNEEYEQKLPTQEVIEAMELSNIDTRRRIFERRRLLKDMTYQQISYKRLLKRNEKKDKRAKVAVRKNQAM